MDSIPSFVPLQDGAVPMAGKVESVEPIVPPHWHGSWERLIGELKEFLAPWPEEIDEFSLASYLAGMCSPEEQVRIEQALAHCPDLAVAIQISQEVLNCPLGDEEG
jgi:hypothetical protein